MNRIDQFFQKDKVQRLCYFILLCFWMFITVNADMHSMVASYIHYLPLIFITPVLLLVLQILFNNRIVWYIIAACIACYTLWTFLKLFTYFVIDRQRAYIQALEWNTETILKVVAIIVSLLLFNWFIWKLKPVKK